MHLLSRGSVFNVSYAAQCYFTWVVVLKVIPFKYIYI